MRTIFAHVGAAIAEIAGCFAFFAWLRFGSSVWWRLGLVVKSLRGPGGAIVRKTIP